MSQEYTPTTWVDETTSTQGTLINAEKMNNLESSHHFCDGFKEVDEVPTEDPGVDYHQVVYCTADTTFYRWDGTEWAADVDDDTKALLQAEITRATGRENDIEDALELHEADTSNPHGVTKAQVGLGNCDNTADADKPVSTAQRTAIEGVQTNLDNHKADTSNPHQVTAAQVGLGNCDNTSDLDKPVSAAMQVALDGKADAATTIAGYNITDAYTKSQTYTREEIATEISAAVAVESTARSSADDDLSGRITAEVTTREGLTDGLRTDVTALQAAVDTKVEIADGVTAWSSAVTYGANSFCQVNGTLYRSLASSNTGNSPASSPSWWEEYASGNRESTGLIGPDNLYTEDIGDGSSTSIAVTHNLTSEDVVWALWDNSTGRVVSASAVKTSVNVLTLTFATAPATDAYRVLVYRPGDAARIYTTTFTPSSTDIVVNHNLGRLPSGISLYNPSGVRVGARMEVDTASVTLHLAGYDNGTYTIMVIA